MYAPDESNGVRRRWHDYQRRWLARDLDVAKRPIVYNSWYATTFDVQPDQQLALADRAAELGAEVFVVDDGWFAGRTSDRTGLGNWWPDPVKFPDGLDPLISGVLARGLRFGIWVEPEAVSPTPTSWSSTPIGSIGRATGRWSQYGTSTFSTSAAVPSWSGPSSGCAGC